MPLEKVHDEINKYFFNGVGKEEWINDILSGRKTPFREVANDVWRAQYDRRTIIQQAKDLSKLQNMNPVERAISKMWTAPRELATLGHGIVFPITHAGDLMFRPASWGTFFKGIFQTYQGFVSKAFTGRMLSGMQDRPLYTTALRSGLDVGEKSMPSGILSKFSHGGSKRAWDMLTVLRYNLWEKQMKKYITPEMSEAEVLDYGKNFADWANHATGSVKMGMHKGAGILFGPKLTASKISRFGADPAQAMKGFSNWGDATPGERAVAMTRLSGLTQYAGTLVGFLVANQGLNMALNTGQNVNFTNPSKSDWLQFKIGGFEGGLPGMHTEIRTLGQIMYTWLFANKKDLRGESKMAKTGDILGQYGMAKLTPALRIGMEVGTGQNWRGRPIDFPWSKEPGTAKKPKEGLDEWALSHGPIPMEGPIGYVY